MFMCCLVFFYSFTERADDSLDECLGRAPDVEAE